MPKEMYSCGEVLEIEYHDEIHEQLHRIAHVDYTKPIIRNGKRPVFILFSGNRPICEEINLAISVKIHQPL